MFAFLREVAGDESLPQLVAGVGIGQERVPKFIVETAVNFPERLYGRCARGVAGLVQWAVAGLGHELPETVATEVVKGILDAGLIVMLTDRREIAFEGSDQIVAQRDFVLGQQALVEQVHYGEQEDRLVRALVRAPFIAPEVVQALQPLLPSVSCWHAQQWIVSWRTREFAEPLFTVPG